MNISVIGAGTMGNGIAHVFAQAGFKVNLIDVNEVQMQKALTTIDKNLDRQIAKGSLTAEQKTATLANITTVNSIADGVKNAGLVIEAATENTELKLQIFKKIDEHAPQECILATNTSSISITKIASVTKRTGLVIGMHFMNPVPVMKLVEIINGYATTKEVSDIIAGLSKQLGKIPCVVNDYPGFIANRILMPMINEAIYSLYEGVAGVEEIDTKAHRMDIPTGKDVCRKQFFHFIDKMLSADISNGEYETYLPTLKEKFAEVDKEEILQRVAALEFDRFLKYYENAADLNIRTDDRKSDRRGERSERPSSPRDRDTKGRQFSGGSGYQRLFVNLGTKDGFYKASFLQFILDMSDLKKEVLGKIDMKEMTSWIEIEPSAGSKMIKAIDGKNYRGRKIRMNDAESGGGRR